LLVRGTCTIGKGTHLNRTLYVYCTNKYIVLSWNKLGEIRLINVHRCCLLMTVLIFVTEYFHCTCNLFHRNMISVVHLFGITSWSPAQDFLSNGWCYIVHIWHKMIVCPFSHTHDHTHSFSNVSFDISEGVYFLTKALIFILICWDCAWL
jgi:hypothetical protein